MDTSENDHPQDGLSMHSHENTHYQKVHCYSNGRGVVGLNCMNFITLTTRIIIKANQVL